MRYSPRPIAEVENRGVGIGGRVPMTIAEVENRRVKHRRGGQMGRKVSSLQIVTLFVGSDVEQFSPPTTTNLLSYRTTVK